MTRRLLLPLVAALGCLAQPKPAVSRAGAAQRPRLVLGIVVDQFRYDYLERFRADYKGGLAKFLSQGAVFTNAHYEHFPTVTAIGHSTFMTGATPSVSGIVGNEWYDRESGKQVTSVSDDGTKLLGGEGRGSSPHRMLVSTICDELKMSGREQSKCVGISMKDRSAVLPVGRMADAAYWFDNKTGNFVSSTYYFPELPRWAAGFNASRKVDAYAGKDWLPGAGVNGGKAFLKLAPKAGEELYKNLERTPYGNDIVALFAELAVEAEKLGQRGATDVLTISFSANDRIGHDVGPDDPRVRDVSIRTDEQLAQLFTFLDKKVGMENVLVVMTADHGVAPLPEKMRERRMPGGRLPENATLNAIEKRLTEKWGAGPWVAGKSGPAPYLDHKLIERKKLNVVDVRREAALAARSVPHIARVYTQEQLAAGHTLDDVIDRRVRAGFHAVRGSDLFIVAEPYHLFEKSGTSHGTPYNYDTHVPVIFMGAGVKAGRYHRRVAVNDIATTLATMLGVEIPSGSAGRVLEEMLPQGK
jgi:hypothetical protein